MKCEICGKEFYTRKAMKIHQGLAHKPDGQDKKVKMKALSLKIPNLYYDQLMEISRREKKPVSRLIREAVANLLLMELPIFQDREPE